MRRTFLFVLILLIPLVLIADDYVPGPPLRVDFVAQHAQASEEAYVPGPPLRVDFVAQHAQASEEAYVPGPPLRVDFVAQHAQASEEAYVPGPPLRMDFVAQHAEPPFISGYDYDGNCPRKNSRLVVVGERFGSSQGTRRLVMEGRGVSLPLSVRTWSDREIALILPDDSRIATGEVYFVGIQDENGRWISNIDRRFTVCP